jgi:hypothetical protein
LRLHSSVTMHTPWLDPGILYIEPCLGWTFVRPHALPPITSPAGLACSTRVWRANPVVPSDGAEAPPGPGVFRPRQVAPPVLSGSGEAAAGCCHPLPSSTLQPPPEGVGCGGGTLAARSGGDGPQRPRDECRRLPGASRPAPLQCSAHLSSRARAAYSGLPVARLRSRLEDLTPIPFPAIASAGGGVHHGDGGGRPRSSAVRAAWTLRDVGVVVNRASFGGPVLDDVASLRRGARVPRYLRRTDPPRLAGWKSRVSKTLPPLTSRWSSHEHHAKTAPAVAQLTRSTARTPHGARTFERGVEPAGPSPRRKDPVKGT